MGFWDWKFFISLAQLLVYAAILLKRDALQNLSTRTFLLQMCKLKFYNNKYAFSDLFVDWGYER